MRLELQMQLNSSVISNDYRRIIISYLKYCISACNKGKYFDRYFKDTNQKDYSFTVIFPNPKFAKNKIELSKPELRILFSADNKNRTGLIFYAAFLNMKNKKFPLADGNSMVLKSIRQKKEVSITQSTVLFRTCVGNGLCIREHNKETNRDRFVTYLDEDFREKALEVLKVQARVAGFSEKSLADLDIEPVQCKKIVVYNYQIYTDVTVGVFALSGNTNVLQYFYLAGLGSKHSAGFGMCDVLSQG